MLQRRCMQGPAATACVCRRLDCSTAWPGGLRACYARCYLRCFGGSMQDRKARSASGIRVGVRVSVRVSVRVPASASAFESASASASAWARTTRHPNAASRRLRSSVVPLGCRVFRTKCAAPAGRETHRETHRETYRETYRESCRETCRESCRETCREFGPIVWWDLRPAPSVPR